MENRTLSAKIGDHGRKLAVALLLCFGFVPSTLANSSNPPSLHAPTPAAPVAAIQPAFQNGEVLNSADVDLYQQIFSATTKGDSKTADTLMTALHDRQLVGHVLAERYRQQGASLSDYQNWLISYRDLPEAPLMYSKARALPGAKKAELTRPLIASDYSGGHASYTISSGFRTKEAHAPGKISVASRRALAAVNHALRSDDPDAAKKELTSALQHRLITKQMLVASQSRLAADYLYDGNAEEAARLTQAAYMQDNQRAVWVNGLGNFGRKRYNDAAQSFILLAKQVDLTDGDRAAAAFWVYRSYDKANNKVEAQRWLHTAANTPHNFYGMLAGSILGQDAGKGWAWNLPQSDHDQMATLAKIPAGSRALALLQVGRSELAEQELRHINLQGRHELQATVLAVAEKNHMAPLALKLGTLANNNGRSYDAALYPVPSWQPKDGYRIDRSLMYALMRHESHFDPRAVSAQGACGLMQLMPATASSVGATYQRDKNGRCPEPLFDPATNLNIGQNYIGYLSNQPAIGDNLVLLLTAYNGGPARLTQQQSEYETHADPLMFMESLASPETHDYVQDVMIQYWSYRSRLHQPLQSLAMLAKGEWPHYLLHDTGTRQASAAIALTVASNVGVH